MGTARTVATAALDRVRVARHTRTWVRSVAKATFADRRTGVAVAAVVPGRQVRLQFRLVAQVVAVVLIRSLVHQRPMRVVAVAVVGRVATPVAHRHPAVPAEAAVVEQVEHRRGVEVGVLRQMDRTGPTGSVVVAVEVRTATIPSVEAVRVRAAPVARASSSFAMPYLPLRFLTLTLHRTPVHRQATISPRTQL